RRLAVGTHHGCRRPNTRVSGTGPSVEVPVGKIVAAEYVSVDGVMQDPGGVGEIEVGGGAGPYWNYGLAKLRTELPLPSAALLLGRVTYEGFAAAWPDMEHEEGPFADKMNTMPKYVASRTLTDMKWNATPIRGDVAGEVAKLKRDPGQNLLIYGSGSLVRLLLQHGLLDQLRLMIHPVVLLERWASQRGAREPRRSSRRPRPSRPPGRK